MNTYKRYTSFTRLLSTPGTLPEHLVQEGKDKNMQMLCYFGSKALYQKSCGHLFLAQPANVRHQAGTFCFECSKEYHAQVYKQRGVTVLEDISPLLMTVRIDKCLHVRTVMKSNIVSSSTEFKCLECVEERLKQDCLDKDVTLICKPAPSEMTEGFYRAHNYALFKYNTCGHTFVVQPSGVRKKGVCLTCANEVKSKILEDNGYKLEKELSAAKGLFSFLECGHERELYLSAALRGNAVCHECNDSTFDKPSNIYLFKFKTDAGLQFLKFGYGKNLVTRVREYRLKNCKLIDTLLVEPISTGRRAMQLEKVVHVKIKEFRLEPSEMKQYLTRGGYSECYPCSIEDKIRSELSKVLNE